MISFLVIIIIFIIALGTLLFMLGYGILFLGAFSSSSRTSVILLTILCFSSVGFVYLEKPWYYALPFWLIPIIYSHINLPHTASKKFAVFSFWLGIVLFSSGTGILSYSYLYLHKYDIKTIIEKTIIDNKNN